ncbi:MAG: hypothetical protein DRI70_09195, partial [Bacteroidetes bacterium]
MGELLDDLNEIGEVKDFVKNPEDFAKGKLKGAAKKWITDAAFGPQMSAEMTEVFRRVASRHYNSNVGGRCPRAAHGNAWSVLFDLKSNGAFMWLPRALTSSVETIITQDWAGWIKDKAKNEIENKLKEYFDGIPPESYSTNSTKGECTFGVLATIDYKRNVYEVLIVADCKCRPVRIPLDKGHGVVAGWRLFASGSLTVTNDDSFVRGRIGRVKRYEFGVDCNCSGDDVGISMFDTPSAHLGETGTEEEVKLDCDEMARLIAEEEKVLDEIRKLKSKLR